MNSAKNLTVDDIINQLKVKKSNLLMKQQSILNQMTIFFKNIKEAIDRCERQTKNQFDQDLLNFQ